MSDAMVYCSSYKDIPNIVSGLCLQQSVPDPGTNSPTLLFKGLGSLRNVLVFHENIHEMSCKMSRKYSQDIDKVINNDFLIEIIIVSFKLSLCQRILHLQQVQPCRPLAF